MTHPQGPENRVPDLLSEARHRLAWLAAIGVLVASVPGAFSTRLYRDAPLAPQVQARGNDLVTLGLAVPLLLAALVWRRRRSGRADAVALGVLAYVAFTYAYLALTLPFGLATVAYVALIATAAWAAVPGLAAAGAASGPAAALPARKLAAYGLAASALLLYPLWAAALLEPARLGALIPMEQVQLVLSAQVLAVLFLAGAMPLGVVPAVRLYRYGAAGRLLAAAAAACLALLHAVPAAMAWTMWRSDLYSSPVPAGLSVAATAGTAVVLLALVR